MSTHGTSVANDCAERLAPRRGVEPLEIAHFALAVDQHAARLQVLVEAGEREAGLLDVGVGDAAIEAARAGEQIDRRGRRIRGGPPADRRRSRPEQST